MAVKDSAELQAGPGAAVAREGRGPAHITCPGGAALPMRVRALIDCLVEGFSDAPV